MESPYGIGRCLPLAAEIVRLGHAVHVLALHHNLTRSTPRALLHEGVRVTYVGPMHVRKINDTSYYYSPLRLPWIVAAGAWGLTRAALALHADVYHIGKPHPQNSIAGILAARLKPGARLILDYDDYEAGINRFGNRIEQAVLSFFEEHVPGWMDGVTTHSSFLARRLAAQNIPSNRILRLPSAFDRARFAPASATKLAQWRQRLELNDNKIVVYVGTVSFVNHAVDLLLYAFALVAARRKDTLLVIVGGGQDLAKTKALADQLDIAHLCRFTGRVESSEVAELLQLAAVSVDPIRNTPTDEARWPLKIVESLAAGVPILTGDVGDRREMLGNGEAGMLVRADDADALAQGMKSLLATPDRLASMVAAAHRLAGRYNAATLAPQLLAFYQSVRPLR